ncbi:MAG: MFS transporter [Clostridia bacterium]|nr:MFS transporter [Clostridia bacterium]
MKEKRFDYTWVIVALCFLSVCISLGFCSSGRTMYLTAITDALNIPRSAFSLNDTFRYVTTTILSLFFGKLVNKFGTKKLMCAGFICLIGFAVLNSIAEHLIVFYIGGILLGVGLSWTGTTMVSVVINRWCKKNKGTITGAILAANGLGGAVSVQILSPIIFEEGNVFGYRNSYRLVALILAVVLVLLIVFFRDVPKGEKAEPVAETKKRKARGTGWVGMEYTNVVKKPYFYLALVCMAFTGMSLQGLGGISTPHMYDMGMDKAFVATLMTVSSLCLLSSKFLTGFLFDRTGMRITMNIALASSFISLVGLVLVDNSPIGQVIAFVRIIFAAIALPLETVMLPLFASDLFGNKHFDKIVGLFYAASTAGFALGSPFANLCHDLFGNYNVPFIVFAGLMLFVAVTMQFVLNLAHRDRDVILAEEAAAIAAAEAASASATEKEQTANA